MEKDGFKLIKLLLEGLQELIKYDLTFRNICPTNIYITDDFEHLVFNDACHACKVNGDKDPCYFSYPPYNPSRYPEFKKFNYSSRIYDKWAIGIIILEILLGTKITLIAST
jgi:serine/threonine protein kinase